MPPATSASRRRERLALVERIWAGIALTALAGGLSIFSIMGRSGGVIWYGGVAVGIIWVVRSYRRLRAIKD
jgi:hypothetical protein